MSDPSEASPEVEEDCVSSCSISSIEEIDRKDAADLRRTLIFLKGMLKAKDQELTRLRQEKDALMDSKCRVMAEMGAWKKEAREVKKMLVKVQQEKDEAIDKAQQEKDSAIESKFHGTYPNNSDVFFWSFRDGVLRRVPPGWTFPMCPLAILWEHWCCGDSVKRISALRKIRSSDVTFVKRGRHTLNDIKHLCGLIEKEAKRKNLFKEKYTRVEAKKVYDDCKSVVIIPNTKKGSKRNSATLKWSTILKNLSDEQKKRST